MSNEPHVHQSRRYLLGDLPEPVRSAFEEAYFADPDLMEEVWAAEHALVDDYVADRLDSDERRRFEIHYLATVQHRERVAVARALRARIQAGTGAATDPGTPTAATRSAHDEPAAVASRSGFREVTPVGPRDVSRASSSGEPAAWPGRASRTAPPELRPARPSRVPRTTWRMDVAPWRWAAAAALALAAAALVWILLRPSGPVASPQSQSAASTQPPPSTPGSTPPRPMTPGTPGSTTPGATTTPGAGAQSPGATPGTPRVTTPGTGGPTIPGASVLAVTLSPIQLRGEASQVRITVPPGTDRIQLRFEGDLGSAREVSAEIRTVEGRRVWTGGVRIDREPKAGIAATVTVPARTLPPDDYIATLVSIDPNGERSELNRYVFRVARQ